MKKQILTLAISMLALASFAFDETAKTSPTGSVTISSNGSDVRTIFHSLFTQAKKSYVLQPFDYRGISLNLENVEFGQALDIVCKLGRLRFKVQDGIYFISKDPNPNGAQVLFAPNTPTPDVSTGTGSTSALSLGTPIPAAPATKLDHSVLGKKLTTKMQKADIRDVFADFSKQTQIPIEVGESVPEYKIDAFLIDTSLKYSLDVVTKAAGLRYRFTNRLSIEVYKAESAAKKTAGKSE